MIGIWLQRHRISLLFLLILLTVSGLYTSLKLPIALFPSLSFPRILVTVDSGDRPVDRMVIDITNPLEQTLNTVPGIQNLRSTSSRGSADFSVNFNWGSDMVLALLQVQAAINQILPNLPAGTTFNAERMDPTVFPMLGLAITSEHRDLINLRDFVYFQLRPLLSTVPGVARLEILGGQQAEFQVLIDPIKLRAKNLTFNDVSKALAASNVVAAVGRIEDYYRLYLILSDTRSHQIEDIKHTILSSGSNGIVVLNDVAQIISASTPQWTRITANSHDAVLLNVIQQASANTISIAQDITKKLAAFKKQIPNDIQIKPYYDQSQLVINSAVSVRDSIIIGAILAAIILLLFLRNLRMTFIFAMILLCVLATNVLLLHLLHMSFNIMTLGGMAAAVGLIIDDGVVMLEHIMRRLSENFQGAATHGPVLSAAMQMLRPLTGSSLATIIIFLPLAFIGGVTGGFFKALALTMAGSLIISFFFVFLAVPLLGEILLKPSDAQQMESTGPFLKQMHQRYQQTMHNFLQSSKWLIAGIIMLIVAGSIAYSQIGSGFIPHMDEGGFILDYIAPPGTSLAETDRLLRQVEKLITAIPEVDSYSRRTGSQLGGGLTETNKGDFFIHLKKPPRRNIDSIMAELRKRVEAYVPGLEVETAQLMEDIIGDLTAIPQPIEIKIFADDQKILQETAKQIAKQLESVSGVVEIKNGIVISGDAINIEIDRVKAALLGLDPETATLQIQTQLSGNVVSYLQTAEKSIGIRIWTPENLRYRIQQLQNLPLRTANGHFISLRSIAKINIQEGQTEIVRKLKTNACSHSSHRRSRYGLDNA